MDEIFSKITALINEDIVKKTNAIFVFLVTDDTNASWYLDLKNNPGLAGKGSPPAPPDVTLTMNSRELVGMLSGMSIIT